MGFQVSPGVAISELDLTNSIPAVATTDAAFVGTFRWGPVEDVMLVESPKGLELAVGKPTDDAYISFFTASNFLNYGNKLRLVRVVDDDTAKNAVATSTALLIKNRDAYDDNYSGGEASVGSFAAKYPGELGNSLKVALCASSVAYSQVIASGAAGLVSATANGTTTITRLDNSTFGGKIVVGSYITVSVNGGAEQEVQVLTVAGNDQSCTVTPAFSTDMDGGDAATVRWEYADHIGVAPGTSDYATARSGTSDEVHIVVVDEDGAFTGIKDQILETFAFCSLAQDAKNSDGTSAYYKNVLNDKSSYVYWMDHPTGGTNWGDPVAGTSFTDLGHPVCNSLSGGVDGFSTVADGDIIRGYDMFADTPDFNVSLVFMGNASSTVCEYVVQNIAEVRKDCVVFFSPEQDDVVNNAGSEEADILTFRNALTSSSYAFMDTGWKKQYDKYNDTDRWVPCNGDTAGLCAKTDYDLDPWWSPAGLNRGLIKNVKKLAYSPSKGVRDAFYPVGVNAIIKKPGVGHVLFGDKTLLSKPSAFGYLPVRRLFIVLEKAIATYAEYMLFQINDEFTRVLFKAKVDSYLKDIKSRRGIFDFKVVCDESNNTAAVLNERGFVGDIYIKPAPTIEWIQLNFIAVGYEVTFEEIVGVI